MKITIQTILFLIFCTNIAFSGEIKHEFIWKFSQRGTYCMNYGGYACPALSEYSVCPQTVTSSETMCSKSTAGKFCGLDKISFRCGTNLIVKGQVINKDTKKGIPNATVRAYDNLARQATAQADDDGRFELVIEFNGTPDSTWILESSAKGYSNHMKGLIKGTLDSSVKQYPDIFLKPKL